MISSNEVYDFNSESQPRRVLMDAILYTPDGALKVRVRKISNINAHVWAGAPVSAECDAIFKRGNIFVAARVLWSNEKETFIRFYRELDPKDTAILQNRVYHRPK